MIRNLKRQQQARAVYHKLLAIIGSTPFDPKDAPAPGAKWIPP
jgi:hypothetical protein